MLSRNAKESIRGEIAGGMLGPFIAARGLRGTRRQAKAVMRAVGIECAVATGRTYR